MKKENFINKKSGNLFVIEMLLPFFQLFAQYKFGISIGLCLLMVVAVLQILNNPGKVQFPLKFMPFLVFFGYVLVRDGFRALLGPDSMPAEINRMCEYVVMFFLVFVVCSKSFNEDLLYKFWKIAGVVFTLGILYHVVQIYVFGHRISPISIIPGYILRMDDYLNQFRPCSFFAEPAAFTNSMLPLLFLALKRNDFKWAVFCTISILLSTSTVGVFLSMVLWLTTFVLNHTSLKKRITAIFFVVLITFMFLNLDIFSVAQSKFFDVTDGESTFGSRVLVGFELVKNMDFFDLPFGTKYSSPGHFVTDNLEYFSGCETLLKYWKNQRLFLNTFSRLMFLYGIVGLVLFLLPIIRYLKQKNYEAKAFVIMMCIAIFGQSILLNSYFFVWIMIFMLYDNKYCENRFLEAK